MRKKVIGIFIIIFFIFLFHQIHSQESESTFISLGKYLNNLKKIESEGGELFCAQKKGGKLYKYNNCKEFIKFRGQGCYSDTTYGIKYESLYESNCTEIDRLKHASNFKTSYFKFNSTDWWLSLPAEIIPMPGGIYDDESWSQENTARERLVTGKFLGDLKLISQIVNNGAVELVLSKTHEECGEIRDILNFSPVLLADFDHDGIAELLIKGYRRSDSESCSLGSGNTLGAQFIALLKKTSSSEKIIKLAYPPK